MDRIIPFSPTPSEASALARHFTSGAKVYGALMLGVACTWPLVRAVATAVGSRHQQKVVRASSKLLGSRFLALPEFQRIQKALQKFVSAERTTPTSFGKMFANEFSSVIPWALHRAAIGLLRTVAVMSAMYGVCRAVDRFGSASTVMRSLPTGWRCFNFFDFCVTSPKSVELLFPKVFGPLCFLATSFPWYTPFSTDGPFRTLNAGEYRSVVVSWRWPMYVAWSVAVSLPLVVDCALATVVDGIRSACYARPSATEADNAAQEAKASRRRLVRQIAATCLNAAVVAVVCYIGEGREWLSRLPLNYGRGSVFASSCIAFSLASA